MDAFIGEIRLFPYKTSSIKGWTLCDGKQLSILQYPQLYSIIKNAYGGDLNTYFNVPNLIGFAAMGAGASPSTTPRKIGEKVGQNQNAISHINIPSHTHQVYAANYTNDNNVDTPSSETTLSTPFNIKVYTPIDSSVPLNTLAKETIGMTGSNIGTTSNLDNMQPC
ncbi:MAG: phage tail protein, partial [Plesiomonas sp.]